MKKILYAIVLLTGTVILSAQQGRAQVSFDINIGRQPQWGPSGYDRAGFYYLPDIDTYYHVDRRQFIYQEGGKWVFRTNLPRRYRNYDLYNGYKVVINEDNPWLEHQRNRRRYEIYRGRRSQEIIRNSRDRRYDHSDRDDRDMRRRISDADREQLRRREIERRKARAAYERERAERH